MSSLHTYLTNLCVADFYQLIITGGVKERIVFFFIPTQFLWKNVVFEVRFVGLVFTVLILYSMYIYSELSMSIIFVFSVAKIRRV